MVIKGLKKAELAMYIIKSTASIFATMVNDDARGTNFKFTPKAIANLSFSFGFYPTIFKENDKVLLFNGMTMTMSVKEYWLKESEDYAKQLLEMSGKL